MDNRKPNKVQKKEIRDREWHRCIQYIQSARKQVDEGLAVADYDISMDIVLQVELSDTTIEDVKQKIQDMEGIVTWEQRYVFRGRQLQDSQTLASYGIEKGSTLYLNKRLTG
ncbi:hypothetical protein SORBI_3002G013550 [Sorghum bicolor]|uniref:Ubiquitin-like domain-containing protein n=1 Tax=Sorghum bicolor TaxID=4558 RepID=C5X7Y0_SORBI|nr:hypothetical protein SORBI_3002G013550 [Sorghum bicolor]